MKKSKFSAEQFKQLLDAKAPINRNLQLRNYKHKKPPCAAACEVKIPEKSSDPKKKLGKANIILQKGPKSHLEQMNCTSNQNYPLFFVEKAEQLLLKKIENFDAKERLVAIQSIRILANQMQQLISARIHQQVKLDQKEPIEFYNLLDKREERHFRIDRIIKYLSD